MSAPPDYAAPADRACASRNWFIVGLIVRALLIAALVLTSGHLLLVPTRQASGISLGARALFLKAMMIWLAWAGADIMAALLIGLGVRRLSRRAEPGGATANLTVGRILASACANTWLEIAAVAVIVALRRLAGLDWIAYWALLSAVWALVNRLLAPRGRKRKTKILGLAVEGPITGRRAEGLLHFINANNGRNVSLKLLASGDTGDRMQAAYESRRGAHTIYLTGSVLNLLNDRELLAVVAHELAHHKLRRRAARGVSTFALRVVAVFVAGELSFPGRFGGIGTTEGLRGAPVVQMYIWLLGVLLLPLTLALSRREEHWANAMAIEMTDDPGAFISAMKKLARHNRISGEPGIIDRLLFQTHPSLGRTIDQAREYAAAHGIDLDEQDAGKDASNRVC